MLDVSEVVKNAYLQSNVPVQIKLVIDGTTYTARNITAGSVSIIESLCSLETFDLSTVEKNELEFSLFNETQAISDLVGKTVIAYHELTLDNETVNVPLGKYTVVTSEYDTDYVIHCVCHDEMLKFDKVIDDWWNTTLQFPITIGNLVLQLFQEVGVTYDIPTTYNNSDFVIKARNAFFENMKASELLGQIQEIVGGFFKADRTGTIKLLTPTSIQGLQPHIGLYPATGLYPRNSGIGYGPDADMADYRCQHIFGELTIADYTVKNIDKLQIRGTEEDVGIIIGTGENTYVIQGNTLLYGLTDTEGRAVGQNIYNALSTLTYTPFAGTFTALPYVEVGDVAYVTSKEGLTAKSPILYRVLSAQKLSEDSFVTKGTKERQVVKDINKRITVLNQKTHEIVNDVETLSSTITNVQTQVSGLATTVSEHTSAITQTAESIDLMVQEKNQYVNYLSNSNFTNVESYLKYWDMANGVAENATTSYVADADFKDSSGYALRIVKTATDVPYQRAQTFTLNGIDLNGKKMYFLFDIKLNASSKTTQQLIALVQYKVSGSTSWSNAVFYWMTIASENIGKRTKFRYTKEFTAQTNVEEVRVYFPYSGTAETYDYEINNLCLLILPSEYEIPPFGTWVDYAKTDIISQINMSPSGIRINAEKLTVDTSSLDLTFGSEQSHVTIEATQADDGILFDGSGKVNFNTNGEFRATNLDSNSARANAFVLSNYEASYGTVSQVTLDNLLNGVSVNAFSQYATSSLASMGLRNKNTSGTEMNFVSLEHHPNNNWNRILIQNNWISGTVANWIQISNANTTSDFQFYNYNSNGSYANTILLNSTSGANKITITNYQRSGTNIANSKLEMNGDITFTCQNRAAFTFDGDGCQFGVHGAKNGVFIGAVNDARISDTDYTPYVIKLMATNGVYIYDSANPNGKRL